MSISTYSFSDVNFTMVYNNITYSANGEGIGSINISMANDRTSHDLAADGSVMISKISASNGTVTLSVQQTSSLNAWLTRWYSFVDVSTTDKWASARITITAPKMGLEYIISGVSPQKLPDVPFQAQGSQITWPMMAAKIVYKP